MVFGTPFDLDLGPNEVALVGRQGAAMSLVVEELQALGATRGQLVLGVVEVKFADGSEWSYPLHPLRRFETISDPAVLQKLAPKLKEFYERNFPNIGAQMDGQTPACTAAPSRVKSNSRGELVGTL